MFSYEITEFNLQAAGATIERSRIWTPPLRGHMRHAGIDQPTLIAAFLGQGGHESAGFKYTREIWGPTKAQSRYEGRADLGNTQPGDGKRFLGRGLFQITGRANYEKMSKILGIDFVSYPELLETVRYACASACAYWNLHNLSDIAIKGDEASFERLTRKINGGLNGYPDRLARWDRVKKSLGIN